ncbi:Zinc finger C2H2-type,Zinc finger, RING/FYVE/PHD-type [Cinara cedri]|uniref:Zinc finger C2H2-type,Zinc finger, RING/FYVE/PHD-type n=1 Tax=Cinara cedri TaxID=506608 RepID=A0A5E4MHE9_9HEMI|nr:Zinc finger C2H2-type,Zinc finger, RING/FYVE/PHD-type [Cinara cedri]
MWNIPVIRYDPFTKQKIKEELKEKPFSDVKYDHNYGTIHNIPSLNQQEIKLKMTNDETQQTPINTKIEPLQYGNFMNRNQILNIPVIRYDSFTNQKIKEEIKEEPFNDVKYNHNCGPIHNIPSLNQQEIKLEMTNDETQQKLINTTIEPIKYVNFINSNQILNIPVIKYDPFTNQKIKEEIKEETFSDVKYNHNYGTIHNIPLFNQQEIKLEITNDETQQKSSNATVKTIQYVNFINSNQILNIPVIRYDPFTNQKIKEEIKEEPFNDVQYNHNCGTVHNIPSSNQQEIKLEKTNDETQQKLINTTIEPIQAIEKEIIKNHELESNTIKSDNVFYTEHPESNAENEINKKEMIEKYQQKPKLIRYKNTLYTDQLNDDVVEHMGYENSSCSLDDEEQNICGDCNKIYAKKLKFFPHESDSSEQVYECEFCMVTFKQISRLVQHERLHVQGNSFNCNICCKQFLLKSKLLMHKKLHAIQTYTCQICKMGFKQKSYLYAHEQIHTGQLFTCPICKKRFNTRSKLSRHERIHTEDKRFVCQVCKKQFTEKSKLSRHEKIHKRKRSFKCGIFCCKDLCQKSQSNHEQKNHKGKKIIDLFNENVIYLENEL